jgi:hypothetical protein
MRLLMLAFFSGEKFGENTESPVSEIRDWENIRTCLKRWFCVLGVHAKSTFQTGSEFRWREIGCGVVWITIVRGLLIWIGSTQCNATRLNKVFFAQPVSSLLDWQIFSKPNGGERSAPLLGLFRAVPHGARHCSNNLELLLVTQIHSWIFN